MSDRSTSCQETESAIAEAVLGTASQDAARRALAHAGSCPHCSAVVCQWREVMVQVAEDAPPLMPSAAARRKFSTRLRVEARGRLWGRRSISALAVAAALLVGFGARQATMGPSGHATDLSVRQLLADATRVTLQGNGRAVVYMIPDSHVSVLAVSRLPRLKADEVYQVWWLRRGQWVTAAVFRSSSHGPFTVRLAPVKRQDTVIWVNKEPAPGARRPDQPDLLWALLRGASA